MVKWSHISAKDARGKLRCLKIFFTKLCLLGCCGGKLAAEIVLAGSDAAALYLSSLIVGICGPLSELRIATMKTL